MSRTLGIDERNFITEAAIQTNDGYGIETGFCSEFNCIDGTENTKALQKKEGEYTGCYEEKREQ